MSARVEYAVQWPTEPVTASPPTPLLKPDMRLTIPTCSHCGPLDSLEAIERHNRVAANTGERTYPRPVTRQVRTELASPLNGADMLMAAFPPKFAGRTF